MSQEDICLKRFNFKEIREKWCNFWRESKIEKKKS